MKRKFNDKLNTLIKIYNIPIEERWMQYLGDDHYNYFFYLDGLSLINRNRFIKGKVDTYKIEINKYVKVFFSKNECYFETDNLSGKAVVDVGCGWGFLALWFALSGAKVVYGIGFPYQVEFINKLIARAKELSIISNDIKIIGVAQPVERGDKTIGNIEHNSVDCVYYNDVFEHLPDDIFKDALIASKNVLKKNGKLISITHNTDNTQIFERVQDWWTKLETESFIDYRKKIITEKIPGISQEDLLLMVNGTRGLLTEDFLKAIEEYRSSKKIIKPTKLMPAVDLTIDYICENYISPPQIVNLMKGIGFNAYCYAGLMHSRRYLVFQPFARIFKSIFMKLNMFSQTVVFVGVK